MNIAEGIVMLELEMSVMGRTSQIHPTLLHDGHSAVLVDTGTPGLLKAFQAEFAKAGVPFANLTAVILTHSDIDHIGSIQDIIQATDRPLDIYAHTVEQPYIQGEKPSIKMTPERVARMTAQLPEDARRRMEAVLLHPPTAKVTHTVADGDVLPLFGGIDVIFTPGHTPGHISLYHRSSKTLIVGDAAVAQDGTVQGPNPQATPDMPTALESLKKFAKFDIDKAIFYHGGLCDSRINEQFRQIANSAIK
ncbi:MAG: hydrolase [Paenibacillaceae bacterium]|jgi:glyoxylase-like metal-dependent hydrolase (beta-lactamase superfamily II)|nr:hydrolase [Paenibacillaceae bacterium]